jgi:hypothetical protein
MAAAIVLLAHWLPQAAPMVMIRLVPPTGPG